VEVEGDRQAKSAATGVTDPHLGGNRRARGIELSTLSDRQQPGVEAGGVPDREELLRIGAGSVLPAELSWD